MQAQSNAPAAVIEQSAPYWSHSISHFPAGKTSVQLSFDPEHWSHFSSTEEQSGAKRTSSESIAQCTPCSAPQRKSSASAALQQASLTPCDALVVEAVMSAWHACWGMPARQGRATTFSQIAATSFAVASAHGVGDVSLPDEHAVTPAASARTLTPYLILP